MLWTMPKARETLLNAIAGTMPNARETVPNAID